ncbi:short-chain alcohol dehydrogenase [Moelleriella libera RCEF 2490]|uniref:Short-chain alcohol dehydrogenase n=1 Tax=Moelleriella libera RCEF 2490 TaxID=1081109 RepID=A0A168EDS9_9HYPO|nr:short-chain alcohol dehydrogenase [Moelleriella libera RCEF 2490]
MPCLVVVGSGPGIGTHVARKFALSGFDRIALLARSPLQLDEDKDSVTAAAAAENAKVHVGTYAIDITNSVQLLDVLDQVACELGPPDAVFFNAARVKSSTLLEADDEEILYDFKVALPFTLHESEGQEKAKASKPSLLVTSSHLTSTPEPDVFVLSLAKAAQRNLVESLAQVFRPRGVHVGLVVVTGPVAPENKVLSPKNIADETWALYSQEEKDWTLDVVLKEPR